MNFNLAMNEEELQVFESWNKNKARFVHGVGLHRENVLKRIDEKQGDFSFLAFEGEKPFVITSVGELDENKNHAVVIKALAKIKERNFRYVIAGVGDLKETLEKLIQELGLAISKKLDKRRIKQ
jgi:glycosyltransferase involved in cell wall biosynthesis